MPFSIRSTVDPFAQVYFISCATLHTVQLRSGVGLFRRWPPILLLGLDDWGTLTETLDHSVVQAIELFDTLADAKPFADFRQTLKFRQSRY